MFNLDFPITDSLLYDCSIVLILIIIGAGIWLKGGSKWGMVFLAAAIFWAVMLAKFVGEM